MSNIDLASELISGRFKLKNRLCFAGHITNFSDDSFLSKRHLAYMVERLSGGVGMLVCDPVPVHPSTDTLRTKLATNKKSRESFKFLTDECHNKDVPAILQLFHAGAHGCAKTSFFPAWSPSGKPSLRDQDTSHAMSTAEINELIDCFVHQAIEANEAGFSGIEIVAGGNLLFEQFWSPLSNHRQDEWGGNFAERMAFSTQIIRRIREEVGPEFLLGLVMTSRDGYGNSLSYDEIEEILVWHDKLNCVDYFSFSMNETCDSGHGKEIDEDIEQEIELLRSLRELLNNGLIRIAGNVRTVETANLLLDRKAADMIGMVRSLIADPMFMEKYERDSKNSIRPCIRCNSGCIGRRARDYAIACLVNPSAGREQSLPAHHEPTAKSLRIVVAGGGLAGLEAARSGAESGHEVKLFEQRETLGGQWLLASSLPGRQLYGELLNWYSDQLKILGVEVWLATCLDILKIQSLDPDHVVIATGAGPTKTGFQRPLPNRRKLPGVEQDNVFTLEEVLEGKTALTECSDKNVLILDDIGFRQGVGTAMFLAEKGHKVSLLTRTAMAAPELQATGNHNLLISQLKALDISIHTESLLLGWQNGLAEYAGCSDKTPLTAEFDYLVLATTNKANQTLENDVSHNSISFSMAGDCQGARKAHMAVYEGRKVIMEAVEGGLKC